MVIFNVVKHLRNILIPVITLIIIIIILPHYNSYKELFIHLFFYFFPKVNKRKKTRLKTFQWLNTTDPFRTL